MATLNKKIGFLGAGSMGEAFVAALIRSGLAKAEQITINDISSERIDIMKKRYGVNAVNTSAALFRDCDMVTLAVKPQQTPELLANITARDDYNITERKLFISIVAGIPIQKIESFLYASLTETQQVNLPIIRVMPNTPALVLAGMSAMSANDNANDNDIETTRTILAALGRVIECDEKDLDAVTALSGSGPAYIFYAIEAMIEGGIANGLSPENAALLTLTTIRGAVRLIEERNESPVDLRRKVTSPGGTTEAALAVLEKNHVKKSIVDAISAAAARSKELSR